MGESGGAAACAGEKGLGVPCGDTRRAAAAESFPVRSGKPPERGWKKAAETGLGEKPERGWKKAAGAGMGQRSRRSATVKTGRAAAVRAESRGGIGKRRERDWETPETGLGKGQGKRPCTLCRAF